MVEATEGIVEEALLLAGVADAVGGKHRQAMRFGEVEELLVDGILATNAMTLEFDIDVSSAEGVEKLFQNGLAFGIDLSTAERAFFIAGEADETFSVGGEFAPGDGAVLLARAESGTGEHAAEVLVTGAVLDEDRKEAAVFEGDLSADDGTRMSRLVSGGFQACRAVEAIAITESDGGEIEFAGTLGDLLGL